MAKEQEPIEEIIDGKRYSTANAIQICPRHKDGYGDPIAGLYRTAKGNLFVVEVTGTSVNAGEILQQLAGAKVQQ